ncbi:type II toxin-antitoxin system RelE/ParE family toxin [Bordetella petrii]|nr:type II toxin-antitoxin system RelE/ParE family toxin [Bordetella petrii]
MAYRLNDRAVFVYGFAKSERASISNRELKALKQLVQVQLRLTPAQLQLALQQGVLIEV